MTPSDFWRGKRVLLTGHTGFKGAWTALWLERAGACATGFALDPPADRDCLYRCVAPWPRLESIIGDLRDPICVARAVKKSDPEIVIHMAAQALVRRSYADPVETFATNVMGTAHLLSAAANHASVRTILGRGASGSHGPWRTSPGDRPSSSERGRWNQRRMPNSL